MALRGELGLLGNHGSDLIVRPGFLLNEQVCPTCSKPREVLVLVMAPMDGRMLPGRDYAIDPRYRPDMRPPRGVSHGEVLGGLSRAASPAESDTAWGSGA